MRTTPVIFHSNKNTKSLRLKGEGFHPSQSETLRYHFLELSGIGRVIGYDELQNEMVKAIELLEIEKQRNQ